MRVSRGEPGRAAPPAARGGHHSLVKSTGLGLPTGPNRWCPESEALAEIAIGQPEFPKPRQGLADPRLFQ